MSHFSWFVCKVSLFQPLAAKQGKLVALSVTRHKLRLLIGGKKHRKQSCHVPSFCDICWSNMFNMYIENNLHNKYIL